MSKVSVIVPVYNVSPYLRQCMDSLVGQALREIEIVCGENRVHSELRHSNLNEYMI